MLNAKEANHVARPVINICLLNEKPSYFNCKQDIRYQKAKLIIKTTTIIIKIKTVIQEIPLCAASAERW